MSDAMREDRISERGTRRTVTENLERGKKKVFQIADYFKIPSEVNLLRPKRRLDCLPGGKNECRPCPWVSCRYHLALDVGPTSIKYNFPDVDVAEMKETCALDIADREGETLEVVGDLLNVTRERVRQIEEKTFDKLRDRVKGPLSKWLPLETLHQPDPDIQEP